MAAEQQKSFGNNVKYSDFIDGPVNISWEITA